MKTLMIKDLSASAELDREAMASVSGGLSLPQWPAPYYHGSVDVTKIDFAAEQFIGQEQNVDVATGINVAFADHLKSVVKPTQNASNNINFR